MGVKEQNCARCSFREGEFCTEFGWVDPTAKTKGNLKTDEAYARFCGGSSFRLSTILMVYNFFKSE